MGTWSKTWSMSWKNWFPSLRVNTSKPASGAAKCTNYTKFSTELQTELHLVQPQAASIDWLKETIPISFLHRGSVSVTSCSQVPSCPTLTPLPRPRHGRPVELRRVWRRAEVVSWTLNLSHGNSVPTKPAVTVSQQLLSNKQIHLPIRKYHIIPRDSPSVNWSRPSSCIWCSIN